MGKKFVFFPDSETKKALSGSLTLCRHAYNLQVGIIVMVPIFQMRKLRLRDLIKLTQLSM